MEKEDNSYENTIKKDFEEKQKEFREMILRER